MIERVRLRITVSGRVQGVFFREGTRIKALALGLAGMVRNRRDGTVEILVEGPPSLVDELAEWARHGPPRASVLEVRVDREDGVEGFSTFTVEPTV